MSSRRAALISLFVVAPASRAGTGRPASGAVGWPPAATPRRRPAAAAATSMAVVGTPRCAPFAVDLATAAAAKAGVRCTLTGVWGAPAPAPPRGHATRPAERLAAALSAAGLGVPRAGGRGVVLGLPEEPQAAGWTLARAAALAGPAALVVPVICAARPAAFDGLLAGQDIVVLALAADAPAALAGPAAAALMALAPGARQVTVVPDQGGALPRPLRHRTAIRQTLEAVR